MAPEEKAGRSPGLPGLPMLPSEALRRSVSRPFKEARKRKGRVKREKKRKKITRPF